MEWRRTSPVDAAAAVVMVVDCWLWWCGMWRLLRLAGNPKLTEGGVEKRDLNSTTQCNADQCIGCSIMYNRMLWFDATSEVKSIHLSEACQFIQKWVRWLITKIFESWNSVLLAIPSLALASSKYINVCQRGNYANPVFISLRPCPVKSPESCLFQVSSSFARCARRCSETDFSAKQISQPGDQVCRVVTKVICFPLTFVKCNFLPLSVFVRRHLCTEGNPGIGWEKVGRCQFLQRSHFVWHPRLNFTPQLLFWGNRGISYF